MDMIKKRLKEAFLGMKRQETVNIVKEGLKSGVDPLGLLRACREAMEEVGDRFETGEFFLSELIYSAEVFKAVTAILEPGLVSGGEGGEVKGSVVFGTPRGDIHDLGKNIVVTMMRAQGFTVHDLGVDVPPEKFAEEIQRTKAHILALSVLLTPAFDSMREAISQLEEKGLRKDTFVIIGGGVVTDLVRENVGADVQTLDPTEAIRLCQNYLQGEFPRGLKS
jgi:5-methyltetrahydrofolate--homocysteine methyltransferase